MEVKRIKNVGLGLNSYISDVAIWERTARSGRSTFTIGYDGNGRQFPTFFWEEGSPMKNIKELLRSARRGARILRRLNPRFNVVTRDTWIQAVTLGFRCEPLDVEAQCLYDQERRRNWAYLKREGVSFSATPEDFEEEDTSTQGC